MTDYRQTKPPPDGDQAPPPPKWDEVDWDTWTPPASHAPGEGPPRLGAGGPDLRPLFALIDVARSALPHELRDQFNSLVREVLLTLRALIDWYLERLGPGQPDARVEDIPIE